MGSDAEVYLFDDNHYTQTVVPALRQLLLTGQPEPWLAHLMDKHGLAFESSVGTDLLRHCTYLDQDLAWTGTHDSPELWFASWDVRACASVRCPARHHCPLHHTQLWDRAEQVHALFAAAVAHSCLGDSQFVGRTMSVAAYGELLTQRGILPHHPLRLLLRRLGQRGWVLGYAWCGSAEGIHGWLNAEETRALAHYLSTLLLPDYPPAFVAMEAFRPRKPGPYRHPTASFPELSLSFVRTVATIAIQERHGILWGNDLLYLPRS
jgi:hypothetical protein